LSIVLDSDQCDCSCHHQDGAIHIIPCCQVCPHCWKSIKLVHFEQHVEINHADQISSDLGKVQLKGFLKKNFPGLHTLES
jgi:hypothetical protein